MRRPAPCRLQNKACTCLEFHSRLINGCVQNCEIPRSHGRGSGADRMASSATEFQSVTTLRIMFLPTEASLKSTGFPVMNANTAGAANWMAKSGQLFPYLHHLGAFSLFEVQRIDEFLSLLVF